MNEKVISLLRSSRTGLQILAEPIDAFTLFMNYKKGYPPLWVRQKVGSLNDFEGSGAEYMAYLKLLCELEPGMSVMDIGCGCGLMCLKVNENPTLPEYIYPGSYVGIDTDKKVISWCAKNIKYGNVSFDQNPLTDYKDGIVDVVLCKSLFTHLLLGEAEAYLQEVKRLLQPSGRGLATFFLYREGDKLAGRYTFRYQSVNGHVFYEKSSNPRAAVAYNADWLLPKLKELGFTYEIYYGSWRGDNKGLSFQDIVILRR